MKSSSRIGSKKTKNQIRVEAWAKRLAEQQDLTGRFARTPIYSSIVQGNVWYNYTSSNTYWNNGNNIEDYNEVI